MVKNSCFLRNGSTYENENSKPQLSASKNRPCIDYKWLPERFKNWCEQWWQRIEIKLHCTGDLANKPLWNKGWVGSWFYFIIEISERSNWIPISFLIRLRNKGILSLILSLLFNKVASLQGVTLLKKGSSTGVSCEFLWKF